LNWNWYKLWDFVYNIKIAHKIIYSENNIIIIIIIIINDSIPLFTKTLLFIGGLRTRLSVKCNKKTKNELSVKSIDVKCVLKRCLQYLVSMSSWLIVVGVLGWCKCMCPYQPISDPCDPCLFWLTDNVFENALNLNKVDEFHQCHNFWT